MPRVLLVDDDHRLRDLLRAFLQEAHFDVLEASSAAQARSMLASNTIDIMVLDIMMEGEDGLALTQSLRSDTSYTFPILLLTARDTTHDCVTGLDCGADDYMTKPFEPTEFLARLRALLRRAVTHNEKITKESPCILYLGNCTFDLKMHHLKRDGQDIFLTSTEQALLSILAQTPRTPLSRLELAQRVGHTVSERSVDVQIARLRRKIEDDPHMPRYIQTVRHIGYGLYPSGDLHENSSDHPTPSPLRRAWN